MNNIAIGYAFRMAQPYLRDYVSPVRPGQSAFICHALDGACADGRITQTQVNAAKQVIMRALRPACTVGDWLGERGIRPTTGAALQAHRVKWLHKLVWAWNADERRLAAALTLADPGRYAPLVTRIAAATNRTVAVVRNDYRAKGPAWIRELYEAQR